MRKLHFAIFVYISSMCLARDISEQYNQLSENTSNGRGSTLNDMGNTGDSWQPMSRRNWIMLNSGEKREAATASASAVAPNVAMAPSNHRNNMYSQIHHTLLEASNRRAYTQAQLNFQQQQWHKEQQGHSHRLPINYYTYNHSSVGNYLPPTATDVKLIEPYIVTISKMRTHKGSDSDAVLTRRTGISSSVLSDASSSYGSAITLPVNVVGNLISPQKKIRQDIENNTGNGKWSIQRESVDATVTSAPDENNDGTKSFFDKIGDDATRLNEIFLPLQRTLDKVIYFCDIAKGFISNADDDDDEKNENEDMNDNDLNIEDGPSEITTANDETPDKVQGHHSVSPQSPVMLSLLTHKSTVRSLPVTTQETIALTSVGTGRKLKKWKKKLSKFILPLLLAYKLKFLTLIPVFIGGLILLVGTTGLAGFFFALFTAVMSLKPTGGSKSIIVKKI